MPSSGWGDCTAVAGDERGFLYGVARAEADPGTCVIWVADVSASTSKPQEAQDAVIPLSELPVVQLISTTPAIQFDVTAAAASADGHQLLLIGSSWQDDATPVLALVDLYSCQPTAATTTSSSSSHPAAKHKLASLIYVHPSLYSQRQGMRILQATWHPSSSRHFATLSTDNRWRLYSSANLTEAEQTFALHPPGSRPSLGLRRGLELSGRRGAIPPRFTAFAFGLPRTGSWASLAVLFLASDGGVYVLCPVAPFGLRVGSRVLLRMLEQSESTAHAWLLAAFLAVLAHEAEAVSARPHMLETAAPTLQGPLNHSQDSLKLKTLRSIACTLSISSNSSGGLAGGLAGLSVGGSDLGAGEPSPGFSVLATGFSNGVVYAHALELGQIVPCWVDATPQCVYNRKGEVMAVRYEVETVPTRPPDSGLTAVPEEDNQPQAAAAVHSSSSSSSIVSPLLLIERLKINLHNSPEAATSADLEDDWADTLENVTDSDEESDAGYDPSASRGARSASGTAGLGFRAQILADSDEDEDLEDQQLLQLKKVTLHAAPELPGRFWACHDQGCWGVNIRWLQQISGQLESATESGYYQQHKDLPAPQIQELLVSGSQVLGSCVVGNALFGSGCVVLEASGVLSFLRPRPAGVLGDGGLGTGGLEGEDVDNLGLSELQLDADELDSKSRMEDFYSDICRGPRRLPPPPKPANLSQLTTTDPAGLKYLNDMTSWLVQTHVQFATGAHADLVERIKQLHDEVHDQAGAVSQLHHLAAAAVERQSELEARLDRLGQVASSLSERSSLLAGLHWTLPRPTTHAEQQLDKQLEVWEQRRDELKLSWRALRERLDTHASTPTLQPNQPSPYTPGPLPHSRQGLGGSSTPGKPYATRSSPFLGVPQLAVSRAAARVQVTKPSSGPVTAGQLDRLKELLQEQNQAISDAREKLASLFQELEVWRIEHPEVELPARLRSQLVL